MAALIAREAGAQPDLASVWLFGSRARGGSNEDSDLDVAAEFSAPETLALRARLERVRREAEAPIADQWPGFVNLVGLHADDADQRLAQRVHEEGVSLWQRAAPAHGAAAAIAPNSKRPPTS